MQYGHGGDIYSYAERFGGQEVLDFSSNINPRGIPESVRQAMREAVDQCEHYPDPFCRGLTAGLAGKYNLSQDMIFCANGAAEIFFRLVNVLRPKRALLTAPTFSEYAAALKQQGCAIRYHELHPEENFAVTARFLDELHDIDICFLCSPNNPTGRTVLPERMQQIVQVCQEKGIWLVVDECFADFLVKEQEHTLLPALQNNDRLIVVRAFTKMYAVPGVRLGWCASANRELIDRLYDAGQPWGVSVIAQACGRAALKLDGFAEETAREIARLRQVLACGLRSCGFTVFDGEANYLLFYTEVHDLRERLLPRGVMIRDCSNYKGLSSGYFRAAVRKKEENDRFIREIREVLGHGESDYGAGNSVKRGKERAGSCAVPYF